MNRRRIMLQGQEDDEVKEWVELLNESKEVTDQKTVEFNLANADSHEEYWVFMTVDKHTGSEQCKGNCRLTMNGLTIGYYIFNVDYSQGPYNKSIHAWTKPLNLLEHIVPSKLSLQYNSINVLRQEFVGDETGAGKFVLDFPANYTGKITVKILAK